MFMDIFLFDKDRDNIASSIQRGYQKIETVVYKILIFDLEFWYVLDISVYCLYIQISKNTIECSRCSYKPI